MMRGLVAMLGLLTLGAAPPPMLRSIRPGIFVEWTAQQGRRAYRAGGVTATIVPKHIEEGVVSAVTVAAPGLAPLVIEGDELSVGYPVYVGIGVLARGQRPSVIVQTYTGGSHCCESIRVAVPDGRAFRLVDLGEWNGLEIPWPTDLTGDGIADFRFLDDAFLYAFGSYAGSVTPPLVMNIRDGRGIDVSADPAFRALFAADLVQARAGCVDASEDEPNGACAAYAADAARLGRLDEVWPIVLRSYSRTQTDWPASCALSQPPTPCYRDYPTALRAFLRQSGYLR